MHCKGRGLLFKLWCHLNFLILFAFSILTKKIIEILIKIHAKITITVVENRELYYFIIICKCKQITLCLFSYQMLASSQLLVLGDSRKLSIVLANPSIVSMVLSIVFTLKMLISMPPPPKKILLFSQRLILSSKKKFCMKNYWKPHFS